MPNASPYYHDGQLNHSNSISAGVSSIAYDQVPAIDAMYGESSGPNKRPHIEESSALARTQTRQKKGGKKGERKQANVLPLVEMLNDATGEYKKPISIKELLKGTKVDISLLDLVAWSPASCKEIKQLCTRVTKRKKPKNRESYEPFSAPAPVN